MAAGDILKESLLVKETFTVKLNEDIEKGELCVDDGAGILAATAALSVTGKVVMATEDHDYSEETDHTMCCVVIGFVEVQKIAGSGLARKGDKIMLSGTAGEVTKFVAGVAPSGGVSTYYTSAIEAGVQAALNTNARAIGTATETSLDASTTQKMLLGVC